MTTYVYDYPSGSDVWDAACLLDQWGILVSQPANWHSSIFSKRQVRLRAPGLQQTEILFRLSSFLPGGDQGWWLLRVVRSSGSDQCFFPKRTHHDAKRAKGNTR